MHYAIIIRRKETKKSNIIILKRGKLCFSCFFVTATYRLI